MARDSKLVIRVTDEIKEEFERIADTYGMTISALGSYVVGRFIQQEKRTVEFQEKMVKPTVDTLNRMVGEKIEGKDLSRFFESMGKVLAQSEKEDR